MYSVSNFQLECNSKIKINFNGGDLSPDSGLLLVKEFTHKLGFEQLFRKSFKTNDFTDRYHTDDENLSQVIYQILAGYFNDNDADELSNDPILKNILNKSSLALQPTLSRFFGRMDNDTLEQFNEITKTKRSLIYKIKQPEMVLFDIDSILINTYGNQEGKSFNFHYSSNGYQPLLCYDNLTEDLVKDELRDGNVYTSNNVVEFMQPILDEYLNDYSNTSLFLRGDSGFAVPSLFKQCETNGVSYAVRLKANNSLYNLAKHADDKIADLTANNIIDYAVTYDEFYYQAGSWDYPRRVIVKVEKPYNQLTNQYSFIVTNMDLTPEEILRYYCNRGTMENFIKECKNGFNINSAKSASKLVNANRLQLTVLAYNLFNYFRRLVLPNSMRKMQINTIRLKLLKLLQS